MGKLVFSIYLTVSTRRRDSKYRAHSVLFASFNTFYDKLCVANAFYYPKTILSKKICRWTRMMAKIADLYFYFRLVRIMRPYLSFSSW